MKKSLKWLFATMFVLCLFVIAMPLGASAAVIPEEEQVEPAAVPLYTPFYIAVSTDGSFLAPNLSSSTTLSAYSYDSSQSKYWSATSVGMVNGIQMYIIKPSGVSNYALTVNSTNGRVTLQPCTGTSNKYQYWYSDDDQLNGEYLISGATSTQYYGDRLNISISGTTATCSVGGNGTIVALIMGQYIAPTQLNPYGELEEDFDPTNENAHVLTLELGEYHYIDTNSLYPTNCTFIPGYGKESYMWFTYEMITTGNVAVDENGILHAYMLTGDLEPPFFPCLRITDKISGRSTDVYIRVI